MSVPGDSLSVQPSGKPDGPMYRLSDALVTVHRSLTRYWLELAIGFIVIASLYDAWLVFYFRSVIDEENVICRWLISLEPTYVSVFLLGKVTGTLCVAGVLLGLAKHWRRVAVPTVTAVCAFQIGLMGYLHVYDSASERRAQWAAANKLELERRVAQVDDSATQSGEGWLHPEHLVAHDPAEMLAQTKTKRGKQRERSAAKPAGDAKSNSAKTVPVTPFPIARRLAALQRDQVRPASRRHHSTRPVRRPPRFSRMHPDVT